MKLVFAGTKMGREVVQKLLDKGEKVIVSTATSYGGSLYNKQQNLTIISKKMKYEEMKEYIENNNIDEIIDVTHPYAVKVTENIKKCSKELKIPYNCIHRDSYFDYNDLKGIRVVEDYEEACKYLMDKEGNILLTIGSNNLEVFTPINYQQLFVRILPTSQVLYKCEKLGLCPKNIIAMQGPFSYKINEAMFTELNIKYLVTKDSGRSGGIEEKIKAAINNGVEVIMIKRPNLLE
ncbi:MAG: precorrin-6A reductase [Eubacteriaceae bacterium]